MEASAMVSYIEDNLMSGEEIVHRAKLHWAVFLRPVMWFVIAILSLGSMFLSSIPQIGFFGIGLPELGVISILIAIVTGIKSFINYSTSEFGVTNKRVLAKVGFVRRNSIEILLTKVEGIRVNQGLIGRILGYGSIVISGTGGSKNRFHKISVPLIFRRKVQEQIAAIQESR